MGKTIDKIVVSSIAPKNTNVLWDDGENLKIFRKGKWESTSKSNGNNGKYIVPDWDANEDEEGYIKNRTHYTTKINVVTVSKENITNTPYKIRPMSPELYYEENGVERYITLNPQFKIDDEDIEWIDFSANGPPIQLALNNTFLYIKDRFNYPRDNFTFWNETIKYLDKKFIPETIARSADYELPHIKLDISQTDFNITILNDKSVSLTNRRVCDLYDGNYDPIHALIHNGELYNGVITGIKEGKLVQYDVNFETGAITEKLSVNTEDIGREVTLTIASPDSEDANENLSKLQTVFQQLANEGEDEQFFVKINDGLGTGSWLGTEAGGEACIITSKGHFITYTIGGDGSVSKEKDIDFIALADKVSAL